MKYIIDVPASFVDITKGLHIPMDKQGNFRIDTGLKLTPYTEPDHKAIEDAQEEAWEFAKQVSIMKPQDKEECWGTAKYNTINLGYSYKEAKARYEAWRSRLVTINNKKYKIVKEGDGKCILEEI